MCTYTPDLKNFYDASFNGAPLESFERLLFQIDRGKEMADFAVNQMQNENDFYAEILYDSEYPTFGRSIGIRPGFSFGLNVFEELMKRFFFDNARNLESPIFKRSCEVTFAQTSHSFPVILFFSCRFGSAVSVATKASPRTCTMMQMAFCKCT